MSNEERPIPIPRPRQSKSITDETDSTSRAYENFTIKQSSASLYDSLNAQLSDMREEMQKPMPMPRSSKNVAVTNYENSPLNNETESYQQPDLPPKTGAIRKTSNIPKVDKLNNDDSKDDVLSQSSSTSSKSNSEKFATPSPS